MPEAVRERLDQLGRRNLIAILAGVLVVGGIVGFQAWRSDAVPDGAALTVGSHVITEKDVDRRSNVLRALYGVEVPAKEKEKRAFMRDAAQSMALSLIIEDAAARDGIKVSNREARQALDDYVVKFFGEGTEGRDAFVAAMAGQGTSEEEVLKEVHRHLLLNAVFADKTEDIAAPTPEETKAAFEKRKCLLDTPELRRISNIVVPSKAEASEALEEVRSGTPFAQVAQGHSLDSATAEKGGDLGAVSADDLEDAYAKEAFAAAVKKPFGPVKSSHGWNVGVVTAVQPQKAATYAEVRADLSQLLHYERGAARWQEWLTGELKDAEVKYADAYRPKDALALPESMSDPDGLGNSEGACAKAK